MKTINPTKISLNPKSTKDIITKLLKTNDKEKILKSVGEKKLTLNNMGKEINMEISHWKQCKPHR